MLDPDGTIRLLAKILTGLPRLADAACTGRGDLFAPAAADEDPDDLAYRHEAAAGLCRTCPALAPCSAWAASLPPRQRPAGVLAAQVPTPPGTTGRPNNQIKKEVA